MQPRVVIANKAENRQDLMACLEDIISWLERHDIDPKNEYSNVEKLENALSEIAISDNVTGREINRKKLAEDILQYLKLERELWVLNYKWRYLNEIDGEFLA